RNGPRAPHGRVGKPGQPGLPRQPRAGYPPAPRPGPVTMIDQLFNSSTIPLLAKVAAFAERRHEALAGNIANISTPDYRTRDLPVADFRAALEEAVAHSRPAAGRERKAWSYTADAAAGTSTDCVPTT